MINILNKLFIHFAFSIASFFIFTSAENKETSACLEEKITNQIYVSADAIYNLYYTICINKDAIAVINTNRGKLDIDGQKVNDQIIKIIKENINACLIKCNKRVHIYLDTSEGNIIVKVKM